MENSEKAPHTWCITGSIYHANEANFNDVRYVTVAEVSAYGPARSCCEHLQFIPTIHFLALAQTQITKDMDPLRSSSLQNIEQQSGPAITEGHCSLAQGP
ncbi:unnamed protein product [Soboliphyme baturini]|uniref:Uncharacterized protein n=1 Tax=Soboliphyme baturini TaxID=241478 RepID=A0A183J5B6_9BILA|nr:unnamed protein product [Soboliphyme baturini]